MQIFFSFGIFEESEDSLRHFEISFETPDMICEIFSGETSEKQGTLATPFALHLSSYVYEKQLKY